MESTNHDNIITLVSKEGAKIEIFTHSCRLSGLFKTFVEDFKEEKEIPIPDIEEEYLKSIADFLNHYIDNDPIEVVKPLPKYDISETYGKWEDEFISKFSDRTRINRLMEIANFIDCRSLLELSASKVACIIKDFSGQEILEYFGLQEDMTDEDEKRMQDEFEKEIEVKRNAEKIK